MGNDVIERKEWITDRNINYARAGHGPCYVLCIPGSYGSWDSDFKEVLEGFDHEKFTIVAMDAPGYGKSRPPRRRFDIKEAKRDAVKGHKLMKALKLVPFSVIGYSEGARAAIHMAHMAQKTVTKLVVMSTSVTVDEKRARLNEQICSLKVISPDAKKRLLDVYGEKDITEMFEEDAAFEWKIVKEHEGNLPAKELLPEILQHALVIRGENDWLVSQDSVGLIAKRIPNAKMLVCPNAMHSVQTEQKEWFKENVERFLLANEL